MGQLYRVTDLVRVAEEGNEPPACDKTVGVVATFAQKGIARGYWEIKPELLNGHQVVMGGFSSAAADIMMAYAIASLLDETQGFSSIDLQTSFLRPLKEGRVDIEARVVKPGRSVAYLEAELIQNGKLISKATSSMMIMNV